VAHTIRELSTMPPSKQLQAWSGCEGIYLRIGIRKRSWYWRGTLRMGHTSIPRTISLGDWTRWNVAELKDRAAELRRMCERGIDPLVHREFSTSQESDSIQAPTWDDVWPVYLSSKTGIGETYREDISGKWKRSISPYLGSLRVDATTTADIERMFDSYGAKRSTSVHIHRILRPFLPWARRRYPGIPADLLDRPVAKETPSQDRLWREEIIRFGEALRECKYLQKWNVLFLLLTGSRAGILTNWDSSWINEDRIEIPMGLEGLKHARTCLVTPPVANLLHRLVPCTHSALRNCVILLCRKAGLKPLSSHDLRRSYISEGCDIGVPEEVMLALTGHVSRSQIGRVYNHRDMLTRMPQAMQVAEHLMRLLGDQGLF